MAFNKYINPVVRDNILRNRASSLSLSTYDSNNDGIVDNSELLNGELPNYYLDWGNFTNTPTTLSGYGITDAFDGSFISLTNKPTTTFGYGITDAFSGKWEDLIGRPDFKTVSVTGSYNDLTDLPTYSLVATTGDYNDLLNKPSGGGSGVTSHSALTGLDYGSAGHTGFSPSYHTHEGMYIQDPGSSVDREILIWDGISGNSIITPSNATISSIGTISAGADVIAFQTDSPTGNYWDNLPAATSTTMGGFILDPSQMEMSLGVLSILDDVLVPASHEHSWADITSGSQPAPIAHSLTSATYHTVSGLTTGQFLVATAADAVGFGPLATDAEDREILTWNGIDGTTIRTAVGVSIDDTYSVLADGDVIAYQDGSYTGSIWDAIPVRYSVDYTGGYVQLEGDEDVPTDGYVYGYTTVGGKGWYEATGGSSQWTTDANGITYASNVGIGVASDSTYKLSVLGSTHSLLRITSTNNVAGIDFGYAADVDAGRIRYNPATNVMSLVTNNADAITINASGQVGIGATTAVDKLHVEGNIFIPYGNKVWSRSSATTGYNAGITLFDASGDMYITNRFGGSAGNGRIYFQTSNTNDVPVTSMSITKQGKILHGDHTVAAYARVQTCSTDQVTTPTLGNPAGVGLAVSSGANTAYGIAIGTRSTGSGWIQSMRLDGTGTAYDLYLQPSGGTVYVGASINAANFQASTGVQAGTTATGYVQLVSGNSSVSGYLEFVRPGGTRNGYLGYASPNVALTLENSAIFYVTGGAMTVNNTITGNTVNSSGNMTASGQMQSTCSFSSYIADGLWDGSALPSKLNTPGGVSQIRFGYQDGGSGQYHGAIGFYNTGTTPDDNLYNFAIRRAGQSYNKFQIDAGGSLVWGPGTSALDVKLYRSAANVLKTDDTFHSAGDIVAYAT